MRNLSRFASDAAALPASALPDARLQSSSSLDSQLPDNAELQASRVLHTFSKAVESVTQRLARKPVLQSDQKICTVVLHPAHVLLTPCTDALNL